MKKEVTNFSILLPFIQATMNNSANVIIEISSNEMLYEFKILKTIDLLNNDLAKARVDDDVFVIVVKKKRNLLKKKTKKSITFE